MHYEYDLGWLSGYISTRVVRTLVLRCWALELSISPDHSSRQLVHIYWMR